ncbi:hypothetical protein V7O62_04645 [Methanolobus sp. ZRKC2]|uniref:hypothetical protein n=1 Tax=Methanolobus sp. ZRKC2 TaxID=3125783 RepID=UPI00324C0FAD
MNADKTRIIILILIFTIVVIISFMGNVFSPKHNVSEKEALEISEQYLQSKVSTEILNDVKLEDIKYREPAAADLPGYYKISYSRIIRGIQSLDGIQLRVNSETGEVSSYRKTWSVDEDETELIDTEPSILDVEAVELLKEYMINAPYIGKEKADTVEVISLMLSWKEDNDAKMHLVWRIRFKDSTFAYDDSPATAWLDAHSGEMLLLDYERD